MMKKIAGRYMAPHRWRIGGLAFLLLTATGLQLLIPQVVRRVIDSPGPQVAGLLLLFFGLTLGCQAANAAATYFGEDVAWQATNALRADLIAHCLRLDLAFHGQRTPGELIERIDGDSAALANLFSRFALLVVGSLLFVGGVLAVLFGQDWRAGLASLGYVAASLGLLGRFRRRVGALWGEARQANTDLYGFLEERIAGADTVRTSGAVAHTLHRFDLLTRAAYRRYLKAGLWATISANLGLLIFFAGTAGMMAVAAVLYRTGQVTLGTAYLFVHYTTMLNWPLETLTRQIDDLSQASASIGRTRELLSIKARVEDGPGLSIPPGALGVAFEDVTFAYEPGRPVLESISFSLAPGQTLGLLGRTGSGKSTLTRLLCRLWLADAGVVRLGGADLRQARAADLAPRVGVVTQRVQLFHGTVRDNLTLFDAAIPDDRIVAALGALGLGDWYAALPAGLDTVLPPGDGGLSAGQAQLLAFTRVFLKDPGLVILDEPTSRLDPATEALVRRAVAQLLQGRTAIIIAHRLATVQQVDEILLLEHGRIKAHGPRDAVLPTLTGAEAGEAIA